eukprot:scaffold139156_cov28-Tisochrysis_lutea.AAC.1
MKESERMQSSICCNSVADQQGPCTEAEDSSPEHPSCFLLLVAGRSAVDEMDPLALPEPPLPSVTELMNLKSDRGKGAQVVLIDHSMLIQNLLRERSAQMMSFGVAHARLSHSDLWEAACRRRGSVRLHEGI